MSECTVTCFDRVMNLVKPLPKDKLKEGVEIVKDYSLQDLLDFGIENNCFSLLQSHTIYDGIVMWEDMEGNYYEEDYDKMIELEENMGITDEIFRKYSMEI